MKLKQLIYITLAALGFLTSCSDDLTTHYTVGEAINAITLRAGIGEGGDGVHTRAVDGNHAGNASGGKHTNFTSGTQLRLRVDGTWLGKGFTDDLVSKSTTATTGDATGNDNKHNKVVFSSTSNPVEQLYWDDYGSADPNNMAPVVGNGRDKGLTIYGVAVDNVATAPSVSDWTALQWTLSTNQTTGWAAKDLLTSNNITAGGDGTYKFQNYIYDLTNHTTTSSNLLEFTHAMTKITVELTAGKGFPDYDPEDKTKAKFESNPTVTLNGFHYTGSVNVETKTSTPTDATEGISMHLASGGQNNNKATFDALVFPNDLTKDADVFADNVQIITFTADGNTLYVTAEKLNAAIQKAIVETATTKYPITYGKHLLQGWNYKILITVNKTDIDVTATIVDWKEVKTEDEQPKITVEKAYGQEDDDFKEPFDFFRSLTKTSGYTNDAYVEWNSTDGYVMTNQLYWPDHNTHYFFRGVYPRVQKDSEDGWIPSSNVNGKEITVQNSPYVLRTYPSDFAIAFPRGTTDGSFDETCKVGHGKEGICATEGNIRMNFEYAMSKVEVRLKSSATDASHIDLTNDNTKVEIIGGYDKARIQLANGLHDAYTDTDKGDYTLTELSTSVSGSLVTTRDAIVPQNIGNNVVFRITVITNDKGNADPSDDEVDVYEARVNLINLKNSSPATPVTEWEHGKHYIYELDLNKTAINVTATIKDWVTIEASDNIWF